MSQRHDGTGSEGLMAHDKARAELSAWMDGEQSATLGVPLAEHLADCAECQEWQQAAQKLNRQVRAASAQPAPDRTEQLLAAVIADQAPPRRPRRFTLQARAALAAVAAAQFVIIVPALLGNAGGGTPVHSSHELGVFNLALAVGFALAALRPSLARGMLPLAGVASVALLVLAFVDSAMSYTTLPAETPHLITLLGAGLLYLLVRADRKEAGPWSAGQDIARRTGPGILEVMPESPDEPNGV
jgi:predicted anti-sigma-YlaC factor YlaD